MPVPYRAAVVLVSGVIGCGGTLPRPTEVPRPSTVVRLAEITRLAYPGARRAFHALAADAPDRQETRRRILGFLGGELAQHVAEGDVEGAVEGVAAVTELFSPEELLSEQLPRALADAGRFLSDSGSPRGDEARVLSGLWLLHQMRGGDASRAEYTRLAAWGREARQSSSGALESYDPLIAVWEEHARLVPAPDVLDALARLYASRRDSIAEMFSAGRGEALGPEMMAGPAVIQRAPVDVAAVYLKHGAVVSALTRVEALGARGGAGQRFVRALRDATGAGDSAANGLLELAELYGGLGRADVTLALCRLGHRQDGHDARFPLCLARLAAQEDAADDAAAWYSAAIHLAPDEREVYDEALEKLCGLIENDLSGADAAAARALARAAEQVLDQRLRRFATPEPSVPADRFNVLVGFLEMNAGNADAARARFERSLAIRENAEALLQLGILVERTGDAAQAARHYWRALDLTPQRGDTDGAKRAEILWHLGDALRHAGDNQQAPRMYEQALGLWDSAGSGLTGVRAAVLHVRRGIILDRLGRHAQAVGAFHEAMAAAPGWQEGYAQILSHVAVATPDSELAEDVVRRAQRQITLDPGWKVYFALWTELAAGRAGTGVGEDTRVLLEDLSQSDEWWGRLARFGAGALPYTELLSHASGLGEQVEAHFYEGARLFVSGDVEGAVRLFRLVMETRMVSFFEYTMAQELMAVAGAPRSVSLPAR